MSHKSSSNTDNSLSKIGRAELLNKQKQKREEELTGCSNKQRFEAELEFVQCLANPHYLQWLSQNGWFEKPGSVEFLKYLLYWKQPEYSKYLIYHHCLHFLELLQFKEFRKDIAKENIKELIHCQQYYFWMHYRKNRFAEAMNKS